MKHKKEDISMQELANYLQIEESCHLQDETKEQNAHATRHICKDKSLFKTVGEQGHCLMFRLISLSLSADFSL